MRYAILCLEQNRKFFGEGEIPYRRYSPRPVFFKSMADLVKFQNRQ